ncbi:DNA helicase RecQ [Riemerella anatipestifer]|uniref:DNA helicase RecQ n=1 Tax=Riemerella anatipestifer (strain ATCC 11845 / DSM 15868 / JCM 9532 / NCTC 11014) TaxID=693978 RepID=E4TB40_RIEAD|nr:DNA helicase RecQ [Riemerella anatipestifer]ADQ81276.1 ATP-dependent DNA helicase RecQ [Riemerella anatipestifer ATCC 11845 = DSM 15868]AFD55299.1 ATP-dependent DNA helicase recq [Riemerella anatipestifer ATCC 11845 = DSM 15868]MRM91930.1 DNA helicase RecQ [Riemerella anatipestifer]SNV52498.1 ATP-dependent DNA helicase recQ [Riemerella anatipestifer]
MTKKTYNLAEELKKYFGFSTFKGQQEAIISTLLGGKDVFVLMPTGGGKSLCYQLPALISEGTAIVVSPLIALMKNQVDAVNGLSSEEGVAHVLNSSLNKTQIKQVFNDINSGRTKLLYVAPESLIKEDYLDFLKQANISFVAIDEAHCISEWGHDFRPEYRNLKGIIDKIANVPVIALTATATPKVQDDIQKTLGMSDAVVFKESFNRPNLFYEVRPKVDVEKEIVKFINKNKGKSGIVYCLSRKKVEEFAQTLQVNGINALPYHAGLDQKTRVANQDKFLMEECDVIVATIAFGMGIDKPDVRFVIHYDFPKSLESYYQETGRAGRDGGEGHCLAFYDPKDIEKLEKFLAQKSVSEKEVGLQLLNEVVGYAETSMSRRQYILYYFGEEFDPINGAGAKMDDNSVNPPKLKDVTSDFKTVLNLIKSLEEKFKTKDLIAVLVGKETPTTKSYKLEKSEFFGIGKETSDNYWKSIIRQATVRGYIIKDIETYGILRISDKGQKIVSGKDKEPFLIAEDREYDLAQTKADSDQVQLQGGGGLDKVLFNQLKDLRKKIAQKQGIPPYTVFMDPSLEDMTVQYPITIEEIAKVYGVGEGKAKKFGKEFAEFIKKYVEDNNIERPDDMVLKKVANKSSHKVFIIQNTDKKIDLEDIANAKNLSMDELISEMESIVYQGTKLNIDYYIEENFDEEMVDDFMEFMKESESDSMKVLLAEFGEELSDDEVRLLRIKFISDVAN